MTEKQEETYNEAAHNVLEGELTKRAEKQEACANCGHKASMHTDHEYTGVGECYADVNCPCNKFTPKMLQNVTNCNKPKNHIPQVDLNDVLKLVRETLNFSNSKERLIDKLKALHSQEVDVRRQKEDNNSSPGTQNHSQGLVNFDKPSVETEKNILACQKAEGTQNQEVIGDAENKVLKEMKNHKKGCGKDVDCYGWPNKDGGWKCGQQYLNEEIILCPTCQEKFVPGKKGCGKIFVLKKSKDKRFHDFKAKCGEDYGGGIKLCPACQEKEK